MHITFEGEHRAGKGTQIALYRQKTDPDMLVIRGDGSYQGGLEGILSDEEIAFREDLNEHLYKESDRKNILWGIAATACALTVNNPALAQRNLLIDRGPLSRASFLLSQGLSGEELIRNMYPGFAYEMADSIVEQSPVDIESVDFGRILYIRVPSSVLLARIADDDPKAAFRRKNISEKEGLFDRAVSNLPLSVRNMVEVIDGNQAEQDVLDSYS